MDCNELENALRRREQISHDAIRDHVRYTASHPHSHLNRYQMDARLARMCNELADAAREEREQTT